jgi:hypothetical protein
MQAQMMSKSRRRLKPDRKLTSPVEESLDELINGVITDGPKEGKHDRKMSKYAHAHPKQR